MFFLFYPRGSSRQYDEFIGTQSQGDHTHNKFFSLRTNNTKNKYNDSCVLFSLRLEDYLGFHILYKRQKALYLVVE